MGVNRNILEKGWCIIPRQKKDADGNPVPTAPVSPEVGLDRLVTKVAEYALANSIPETSVTQLMSSKFISQVAAVQRSQVAQLAKTLTPEQMTALLQAAGITAPAS